MINSGNRNGEQGRGRIKDRGKIASGGLRGGRRYSCASRRDCGGSQVTHTTRSCNRRAPFPEWIRRTAIEAVFLDDIVGLFLVEAGEGGEPYVTQRFGFRWSASGSSSLERNSSVIGLVE